MSKHERAIRKALAAFEPMLPPHVMTALTQVIDGHLKNVTHFNVRVYKIKTCEVCGYTWDTSAFGDDFKCIQCHPIFSSPTDIFPDGDVYEGTVVLRKVDPA